MNTTIAYYNEHAQEYIEKSRDLGDQRVEDYFLSLLPHSARILDFGCGSGRDLKYFREHGFRAEGTDGSEEICYRASQYTGTKVRKLRFLDLEDLQSFDGIWARASIMHLRRSELPAVFYRMTNALVDGGIIYASFPYGSFEGTKDGCWYTYMDENRIRKIIDSINSLSIEDAWFSRAADPEKAQTTWMNLILRKD
ncbi:MAG: class I SAM-dependent methyltransferase [Lachnospiraceae bacterium]|nr:class I SAM-dependent methyltransferase [Lachnospiraceae bacterium]